MVVGVGAERTAQVLDGESAAVDAVVATLVQALGLERAALLVAEGPDQPLRTVARHGAVTLRSLPPGALPGDGPWSAVLPVGGAERQPGLLLLARTGGETLAPSEVALARGVGDAFSRLLAHGAVTSELARSRELLARTDRLATLGTLAAGVAHEIRNPLVSVRTFLQLLPERDQDEQFRTEFRKLALDETERICDLITDLLSFARPVPSEPEQADLNTIVEQTVRLLLSEARKVDVEVVIEPAADLPPIPVDEARVKQVLLNVVLNAVEASTPHGRVVVTTALEAGGVERWCRVSVADTGRGVPAESVARVFDPFYSTKSGGSGLGLFIAARIMESHGGSIRVRPDVERGAVFDLRFPASGKRDGGQP